MAWHSVGGQEGAGTTWRIEISHDGAVEGAASQIASMNVVALEEAAGDIETGGGNEELLGDKFSSG